MIPLVLKKSAAHLLRRLDNRWAPIYHLYMDADNTRICEAAIDAIETLAILARDGRIVRAARGSNRVSSCVKEQTMSPKPKTANDKPVADAMETKQPVVRRTVFDLDSFDEIVIERPYVPEPAPQSIEDALARLGNSQERLLQIISDGLHAEQKKKLERLRPLDANGKPGPLDLSDWTVQDEDTGVRVPYTGVPWD